MHLRKADTNFYPGEKAVTCGRHVQWKSVKWDSCEVIIYVFIIIIIITLLLPSAAHTHSVPFKYRLQILFYNFETFKTFWNSIVISDAGINFHEDFHWKLPDQRKVKHPKHHGRKTGLSRDLVTTATCTDSTKSTIQSKDIRKYGQKILSWDVLNVPYTETALNFQTLEM